MLPINKTNNRFPLDLPILWHTSMSSTVLYTFVAHFTLLSALTTVDSKLSSEILLGILVISMLFCHPYCCSWIKDGWFFLLFDNYIIQSFTNILQTFNYNFFGFIISFNISEAFLKFSTYSSLSFEISSNILESLIPLYLVL